MAANHITPVTADTAKIFKKLLAILLSFVFVRAASAQEINGHGQPALAKPLHLNWHAEINNLTNLAPAASNGKIYVALNAGSVLSLNAADGSLLWKSDIGGEVSASLVADTRGVYIASATPSTRDGSFYQDTGALRIVGAASGVTIWMRTLPSPLRGEIVSNETTVFGCTSDGHLYAIKKEAGEVAWVKSSPSGFIPSPILNGERLYICDKDGNIFSIDPNTGQTLWRYRTRKSLRTPISINEGMLYSGSSDGSVYAINMATHHLSWRVRTGAAVQSLRPAGKCLLTTSLDNFVYCLSPVNGDKLWKRLLAGRVEAQPLVLGDGVLLSPLSGDECVVLSLEDGREVNSIFVGEDGNSGTSPLLLGDFLLITTRKGLYAFSNEIKKSANTSGDDAPPSR
ncbi:MAG TPA: PQQ-binding-like beta-propeller repeat protein [Pyrinomonadaceae bacterium]|nr:PQQ-binding-like beta-propeller repeat protein [Pyrinomonadaceae bacterium]